MKEDDKAFALLSCLVADIARKRMGRDQCAKDKLLTVFYDQRIERVLFPLHFVNVVNVESAPLLPRQGVAISKWRAKHVLGKMVWLAIVTFKVQTERDLLQMVFFLECFAVQDNAACFLQIEIWSDRPA